MDIDRKLSGEKQQDEVVDQVMEEGMNETGGMDAKEVATLDNQLGLTTVSVAAFNNQLKVDRQTNNVLSVVPPLMEQKWKCPDCGEDGWYLLPLVETIGELRTCSWCGAVFLGHYIEGKFEKWTGQYFSIYSDGAVY